MGYFMDSMVEYFERSTDRKSYRARNIVIFKNGRYHAGDCLSSQMVRSIKEHLSSDESEIFDEFLNKYLGDER